MLKSIPEIPAHYHFKKLGAVVVGYIPELTEETRDKVPERTNVKDVELPVPQVSPTILEMAKSLANSTKRWASDGFRKTDEETLKTRTEICKSCEFWNAKALNNTGRCMKCGCSTWAKLRMATEKCPIGKW